jgi:CheY-like chemotaxis protein
MKVDSMTITNNMCNFRRCLIVACIVLLALQLRAQDPFGAQPPAVPAAPGKRQAIVVPVGSPAAQAIVGNNPMTAVELLRAIDTLGQLGEPDVAVPLVNKLAALKPNDADLAAAVDTLGSAVFFRLRQLPGVPPVMAQIANKALQVTSKAARDPAKLQAAVELLIKAETNRDQAASLVPLLSAGEDGVAWAIHGLLTPNLPLAGRSRLEYVVRQAEKAAIDPLIAAVSNVRGETVLPLQALLVELGGETAGIWLLAPAYAEPQNKPLQDLVSSQYRELPPRELAARTLQSLAKSYLDGDRRFTLTADNRVKIWEWDSAAKIPVAKLVSLPQAQARRAALLANQLLSIDPDSAASRELWLHCQLRLRAWETGLDKEAVWPEAELTRIKTWGSSGIEQVLIDSLAQRDAVSAMAALQLLKQLGPASSLTGFKPHPVVESLRYPNRRVQYAAAQTLLAWNPRAPFNGAGHFTDTLRHLAGSQGQRQAIVGFPNREIATRLAGYFSSVGIEGLAAWTGQTTVRLAQQSPDAELILLSSRINFEPLSITIQELRRDPRTAHLPIVILTEDAIEEPRLGAQFERDPLVTIFTRPFEPTSVKFIVDQAIRSADGKDAGSAIISPAERRAQGLFALTALAKLLDLNPKLYEFSQQVPPLIAALEDPGLCEAAAAVLARIGNHSAQTALVEMASRPEVSAGQRTIAATMLAEAIRAHGVQLTRNQVALQYQRYNMSATSTPETQKILGAVLDAIELPTKATEPVSKQ